MLQNNLDQPFTENDIKAAIKFLKSEKAPCRSGQNTKSDVEMWHSYTSPIFNKIFLLFTEN